MNDNVIFLEKSPYGRAPPIRPTEIAEKVLLYLIKHRKSNVYSIAKGLNKNYFTIRKAVYKQLPGYIRYIEVPQKRYKKQKTKLFMLSAKGYETLLSLLYSQEYNENEKKRIKLLNEIFSQLRTLAPSFLPKIFSELPIEYSIVFYHYIDASSSRDSVALYFDRLRAHDPLSNSLLELLEAKSKNIDKTAFLVNNNLFQLSVPITLKEAKIILEYVKERMKKNELFLNARFKLFNEKKQILKEITAILSNEKI